MSIPYLVRNPPRQHQFRSPRRAAASGVIVIHTAESAMDTIGPDTGAENVARFIANRTGYGSYHRLCDFDSTINLVAFTAEAYGDGTGSNTHAIHISFACRTTDWKKMSSARREAFLRQGAKAAAEAARWVHSTRRISVPAERISRAESDRRIPGFISHAERDPGRRSDPGKDFPWTQFLNYYSQEMTGLEDDMATEKEIRKIVREETERAFSVGLPLSKHIQETLGFSRDTQSLWGGVQYGAASYGLTTQMLAEHRAFVKAHDKGTQIDDKAVAVELASLLLPALREVVIEMGVGLGDTEALADDIVDEMARRLEVPFGEES